MISNPLGTRYKHFDLYEKKLHQPYDYQKYGLINRIISHKIVNSKNEVLQRILMYYEQSFIFVMKFVDRLKHFKNYNWVNR
jgi:hypothetical protein